jgi:hypothetical protein
MQQEDEEAGDVVVRVGAESKVHETVHAAVQPDRRHPPRNARPPLTQSHTQDPADPMNFSANPIAVEGSRVDKFRGEALQNRENYTVLEFRYASRHAESAVKTKGSGDRRGGIAKLSFPPGKRIQNNRDKIPPNTAHPITRSKKEIPCLNRLIAIIWQLGKIIYKKTLLFFPKPGQGRPEILGKKIMKPTWKSRFSPTDRMEETASLENLKMAYRFHWIIADREGDFRSDGGITWLEFIASFRKGRVESRAPPGYLTRSTHQPCGFER